MQESWLPNTRWYDDLDVLGSDEYAKGPGPYLDPGMDLRRKRCGIGRTRMRPRWMC
ncbi:hypothetical protein [Polyangium sp. y55x31]|uniref:hypothetical protein n=1 Tax=Polyangium sp. y55x31 TaxID=3042688 RepID=UPI0024824272|nr:hypothetical protein [Polyangium sp. y55x31]MDI1483603.1 hypothetical protein [Polyangium sp. y55x31]